METDRTRRRLLRAVAAWALTQPIGAIGSATTPGYGLLGAWRRDGHDCVGTWRPGADARGIEIPFRAHEVLVDRTRPQSAIAVARRPGEFLARVDLASLELATLRDIDPEYVTSGHAVFSVDGQSLLVSESDVLTGAGMVAVYNADTLVCHARYSTLGIGPHALLCEPGGTLLVANSGVLTLPQSGRTKLNAGDIDASLVRLSADGRLLGQWRLQDRNLSIRHLTRTRDGIVGIALQAEHEEASERERAPVFAMFDGASLRCAESPAQSLGGYGGDIACIETPVGPLFAVGCTRAGAIALWDAEGCARGTYPLRSACALLQEGQTLIAPSEHGEVGVLATDNSLAWSLSRGAPSWDNHAVLWTG